jgi:hypothetical protein
MSVRAALIVSSLALGVAACSGSEVADDPTGADLFTSLSNFCGQSFEGAVSSDDPRDADWAAQTLTIEFRSCSDTELRIPLHVGEDHSRTWIISRTETGLRLKHDHRHEDGSDDVLTMYGGDTAEAPTEISASFPADQYSKDLFEREGIPASMENTWTVSLDGSNLIYALDRPERHFAATFDLSTQVATPPAPWGAEEG